MRKHALHPHLPPSATACCPFFDCGWAAHPESGAICAQTRKDENPSIDVKNQLYTVRPDRP